MSGSDLMKADIPGSVDVIHENQSNSTDINAHLSNFWQVDETFPQRHLPRSSHELHFGSVPAGSVHIPLEAVQIGQVLNTEYFFISYRNYLLLSSLLLRQRKTAMRTKEEHSVRRKV